MKDAKYYQDAIEVLGESLEKCQPQNQHVYRHAIQFARKRLKQIALVGILIVGCSSCGAVRGFGEDCVGGSDAFMRAVESSSNSYNEANNIPRIVN